jgi:hypothetical protein
MSKQQQSHAALLRRCVFAVIRVADRHRKKEEQRSKYKPCNPIESDRHYTFMHFLHILKCLRHSRSSPSCT